MLSIHPTTITWHKSSFSESGNCVEVATQDRSVHIRDSKNPEEGMLSISSSAWQSFIQAVQCNTGI
jgi:Domain of unknown function (DUF397)